MHGKAKRKLGDEMGNLSILANPHLCVSCKSCMAACSTKHAVKDDVSAPRLRVTQLNMTVTAPVVCHHCKNAPCVAACPEGALYQDEANHRVGIDSRKCIGCRSCVMACPFGSIVVATPFGNAGSYDLLGGTPLHGSAVKCDRCIDREEGPACIQACSFGALNLVERDESGVVCRIHKGGSKAFTSASDAMKAKRGEK